MTFLPIVERELRVAARKKGTYLTRVGVAMGAMVLGGVAGLVTLGNPSVRFGTVYFQILSGLAMLYSLGAGRFLTADCLSAEKREETMGLLFLTDLKGYDVVLGKMAATSLNGLYGLLAVLPVLAITLLTGGIAYGEFCRVALLLLDTFLFSLAVGIFASALTREFRSAMALNFYVLLGLGGLLPALAWLPWFFYPNSALAETMFLPCPVYALVMAFDAPYKLAAAQFWSSAGVILAMSWLLLALACAIAPRSWQTKPAAPAKKASPRQEASRAKGRAFRRRLLHQNAYYWLAARPRWKARLVWVVIGLALCWLVTVVSTVGWLDESICVFMALTLNGAFKLWITLEAGQSLAEDAKSGAFELLLSTPLAGREIVRGQILALRRQFLKPLVGLAGIELYFMWSLMAGPAHLRSFSPGFYFCLGLAGILMLAADAITLSFVAMAAALTEKNQTMGFLKTVRRVLVLPWVLWAGVAILAQTWAYLFPEAGNLFQEIDLGSWFVIGMVLDLLFAWRAWRRLTGNFQELALRRFAPAPARAGWRARCAGMGRAIRDHVWRHPRNRKWAVRLATVLAIGISLEVWESNRSHDPPPEIALTGPGNETPLQAVVAGEGVFLILPDGSLWRWGQTEGTNRSVLPERVGTNRDWRMVSVSGQQRLGVRRDGTLWEWQGAGAPAQVGAGHDWVEAVGSATYKVARKKDGALWAWGDVVLSSPPPSTSPVWIAAPAATNHVWKVAQSQGGTAPIPIPQAMPSGPAVPPRGMTRGGPVPRWRGPVAPMMRGRRGLGPYNLAVDGDGRLWVWGIINLGTVVVVSGNGSVTATNWVNLYPDPIQVCRETNWVGLSAGMAQNNQGDLWDLFAAPPNPTESIGSIGNLFHTGTPVLLGTNRDWMAVAGTGNGMVAVRADGTLWGCGDFYGNRGAGVPTHYSEPGQLCEETNWIGVDRSFGTLLVARNNAGELWWLRRLGDALPDATASARSLGDLLAQVPAASLPAQTINPFRAGLSRYEVHTNGTLWFSLVIFSGPGGTFAVRDAEQAGQRTDWIAAANAHSAAFGLTADGTLWTWGWNLGEQRRVETRSRIEVAKLRAAEALGLRPSGMMMLGSAEPTYPIQEKPRALMRLLPQAGE